MRPLPTVLPFLLAALSLTVVMAQDNGPDAMPLLDSPYIVGGSAEFNLQLFEELEEIREIRDRLKVDLFHGTALEHEPHGLDTATQFLLEYRRIAQQHRLAAVPRDLSLLSEPSSNDSPTPAASSVDSASDSTAVNKCSARSPRKGPSARRSCRKRAPRR